MIDEQQRSESELSLSELSLSDSDEVIVSRLSASWLFFLSGAFFLALGSAFTHGALYALSLTTAVGTIAVLWKYRPSKELTFAGALVLVLSFIISFPSSPSVFSGRDQGSYAEAAIRLAHDASLRSHTPAVAEDFFRIYGEGKALNVPGFFFASDGSLTTQFPLGIIVWFGAFVSLFDVAGLSIANMVTLFCSLMLFFLFLRRFFSFPFAISGILLAACSFPFIWIQENTLSENLALPLFLLLSFQTVSFLKKPAHASWILMFSSALFLSLTRIEGAFMIPMVIFLLLVQPQSREYLKKHLFSVVFPTGIISGLVLAVSVFSTLPFYRTVGKALLETRAYFESNLPVSSTPFVSSLFRIGEIFWLYGMIPLFSMAVLGGTVFLRRKKLLELTPLFIALPTFFYFLSPSISPDHPWMLRRFVFSVWPTAILLAVFASVYLQSVFQERFRSGLLFRPAWFSVLFSSLLILPTLPTTLPVLFFSENSNLLSDTETLSSSFSDRDLVLVDRMSSGDPFVLVADPMSTLFGKNAIYFFNPNDLNKLDLSRYDHVYLLAQNGDEVRYQEAVGDQFDFRAVKTYSLRTSMLSRETDPSQEPVKKSRLVTGIVFLVVQK